LGYSENSAFISGTHIEMPQGDFQSDTTHCTNSNMTGLQRRELCVARVSGPVLLAFSRRFDDDLRLKKQPHTLVFRSTHSKQDSVGLFRFCFFLGWSVVAVAEGEALLLSRSSSGDTPRPGLGP
jgi:hypothetical protein